MTGSLPMADLLVVLRFGAVLALGTWAARPLALRLVPGGGGWIAALLLAWLVLGWVPWALAALRLLPFGTAALGGLALLVALRFRAPAPPPDPRGAAVLALAFAGLFWLGLAQRLGLADLSGLEKFTDVGFLAAAMRAEFMPPADAWYAGETVNYYYVGQAMAAAWGLLAGTGPDRAYQIAMAALFAMSGLGVWHLATTLARPAGPRAAPALGALAALLTLYGGNFHSALYIWFRGLMPATNPEFYFPDSTRFIGFDPDVADKGFTEFIAYAFAVGDLHAHVAAIPVFLLGVMVLLAFLARGLSGKAPDPVQVAAFGWVLGLSAILNSWDVAVLGLLGLFAVLRLVRREALDDLGLACVIVVVAAFLTAAPFLGWFTPFASGIEAAPNRTPLWQLLVLYGHAVPPALLFGLILWKVPGLRGQGAIGLLLGGALALILVPEVVIVRDIYGIDFARANTMFKLTFRAQTLLIVASVAVLGLAFAAGRRWWPGALVAAVPLLSILAYAPHIARPPSVIRSLDGLAFLGEERALVEAARHLPMAPGEALIEASGPAFGESARVSAMTGQPAVVGWAAHQWLWRNDGDRPNQRAAQVERFYTTTDQPSRCAVVRRFNIRYAVLGQVETRQYPGLQAEGVRALGVVVHDGPGGQIVQIDRGLCR